jgi:hypothetical protein
MSYVKNGDMLFHLKIILIMLLLVTTITVAQTQTKQITSLREAFFPPIIIRDENDVSLLFPEKTPATQFLKYSFHRLDDGDVRTLALVMRKQYAKLCIELNGRDRAEKELEDIYTRRYNEILVLVYKMQKLGLLIKRLNSEASSDDDRSN